MLVLLQAMEGWGTDETKLTQMICCKSPRPWHVGVIWCHMVSYSVMDSSGHHEGFFGFLFQHCFSTLHHEGDVFLRSKQMEDVNAKFKELYERPLTKGTN